LKSNAIPGKKETALDEKKAEEKEEDSPNSGFARRKIRDGKKKTKDAVENSASYKMKLISSHFHTNILPLCVQFTAALPVEPEEKGLEYRKLREVVVREVLVSLHAMEFDEDTEDSTKRGALIREVEAILHELDAKVDEDSGGEHERSDSHFKATASGAPDLDSHNKPIMASRGQPAAIASSSSDEKVLFEAATDMNIPDARDEACWLALMVYLKYNKADVNTRKPAEWMKAFDRYRKALRKSEKEFLAGRSSPTGLERDLY
jgi:hypothetical protein